MTFDYVPLCEHTYPCYTVNPREAQTMSGLPVNPSGGLGHIVDAPQKLGK